MILNIDKVSILKYNLFKKLTPKIIKIITIKYHMLKYNQPI